jgi:lipoprotein-releasing system ATP-binding protein
MQPSPQPILSVRDIHKTFYHPVALTLLRGVSLTVAPGETVAIMGRSGEGKSTLLHIFGTLDTPCTGSICIAGEETTRGNRDRIRNTHIGFVFQSFHLLEDYSALDNILMPARIARKGTKKGSEAYERACHLLEKVGLAHRMHFNTKLLSGGEKQRIGIARALANNPSLILADEPSGNLDRQNSRLIHETLLNAAVQEQKAVIVVTHDIELARLCSLRYQLIEGRLENTQEVTS